MIQNNTKSDISQLKVAQKKIEQKIVAIYYSIKSN